MTHVNVEKESRSTVVDFPSGVTAPKGDEVQRIDGHYLYQVGAAVRPLTVFPLGTTRLQFNIALHAGEPWIRGVLTQTAFPLRTAVSKGWELVKVVMEAKQKLAASPDDMGAVLDFVEGWQVSSVATDFQTLLSAELSLADMYAVSQKGAYNTTELAEGGLAIFPPQLSVKVPDAVVDARQAARCIAFELNTAAAFHMHLVLERVMRAYYTMKTGGQPFPDSRNIGAFIDALKNHHVEDKKVTASLSDVKKFHRNPVLHADDRIESSEEALALLGSIYSVMAYMLKELPEPKPTLVQHAETKAVAAE